MGKSNVKYVRSVCPLDCPDTCGLTVKKENGKITSVTGDKSHPITKGVICHKARKFPERTYHSSRLYHPLKRVGPKGDFSFKRISWDEAYDEITKKYHSIIKQHGANCILPYSFYGNMGLINSDGMDRRFFHRLGACKLNRTICNTAASEGYRYTMGFPVGINPEETIHSKFVILWGCHLISTNMHQVLYLNKARKNGAKIVVIDVHNNRTAKWADWFIQVKPGTDTALALGMMHVLIKEDLINRTFIHQFTKGFEELAETAQHYTPENVEKITGISSADIVELARQYGESTSSFIRIGNGLQHHENGGMMVRAITCLPSLTGHWQVKGGGALKGNGAYADYNFQQLQRPDLHPDPNTRTINMNQLGNALLDDRSPIYSLFIYNSNPAQVTPDQTNVRKGLLREDLFTVVHDLFLTDSCKYADLVLPATSHFENLDLYKSYWHLYIQLNEPIIEPLGECKSNFTLFKELAARMGFNDPAFKVTEEEMIEEALSTDSPFLKGITLENLKKNKIMRLYVTKKDTIPHKIQTPSGKIEFYSEQMKHAGLPPVPNYIPVHKNEEYEFELISGPNHQFINSSFSNIEELQRLEEYHCLLHPKDAERRNIKTGERLKVYNENGEIYIQARVTDDVLPGVIITNGLWWDDHQNHRKSVNFLTSQRLADMGGGASFFSVKVNIRKCI